MVNAELKTKIFIPKTGELIKDKYKIVKVIGNGGYGRVYLAKNIISDEDVAIKIINKYKYDDDGKTIIPEEQEMWYKFKQEININIRLLVKTCYENLVKYKEVINLNDGDTIIIVMEYINGITLDKYIEKNKIINTNDAMFIFKRILLGIRDLHSFKDKIFHRDLKPENIMISEDLNTIKLIDFGIATSTHYDEVNNKYELLTVENQLYGSPEYLSPQALEFRDLMNDEKAKFNIQCLDFYAAGAILYLMLVGSVPFADDERNHSYDLAKKYDLPCISNLYPHIPKYIENIIFKCMANKHEDIKHQYKNVEDIIKDVKLYFENPTEVINAKLIKHANNRLIYSNSAFDLTKGDKEAFFEAKWFYGVITCISIILIIAIIVKMCL